MKNITRRDYFIAAALQGIMSNQSTSPTTQLHFENIAEDAVRAADTTLRNI